MLPVSPLPMGLACSKQSLPFWSSFRKKRCASPVWTYASLLHNTFSIPQNHAKVKGAAAPFFSETGAHNDRIFTEEPAWIGWKKSEKT